MDKLIHCCWFGGKKPPLVLKCQASWVRFAPNWEIREWDETRALALRDLPGYGFFTQALAAKKWAMASDWLRMAALWKEGGVYLDTDVELVGDWTRLCEAGEWVAGEWTACGGTWMNPGSGLALERESPVAGRMLEAYGHLAFDPKRDMMPWINDNLSRAAGGRLRVLPPKVMSPIDLHGKLHRSAETVGIHHYALSWGGPWRKTLQWISWHGGRGLIDFAVRVKHGLSGPTQKFSSVVASFWEEHCLECGMPACYGTCELFVRGWHGRCVRIEEKTAAVNLNLEPQPFTERICSAGKIRFRRWGKLEMMYHGRMMSARTALLCEKLNRVMRPVWRLLGMKHRAVRWRLVAALGRKGRPTVWRLRLRSECAERLAATIAYDDGREVWREAIELRADVERTFEWPLPTVEDGALFRLFPLDGDATGWIECESRVEGSAVSACDRRSARASRAHSRKKCARGDTSTTGSSTSTLKCVAWDLDGVVWDGTLSEGDDVTLRPGVMEAIRALDEVGIVSSLCSKNDADAALSKLKELGVEEWFVFPQINWGPKSASLRNLAAEMNIGLDAIAFVDDRAENRAEVKVNCPGVRILDEEECFEFGRGEVERLRREVREGGLGPQRRRMYREEMARRGAAQKFAGGDAAFAEASGLSFELLPVTGERIARCRELVQRTNQLNLTARRYDKAAFADLLAANECTAVRVWDRYGDYGIVGFLAKRANHLVECCFSCRSAGRGVERKVLAQIAGGRKLTAEIVETDRNAPIRKIMEEFL